YLLSGKIIDAANGERSADGAGAVELERGVSQLDVRQQRDRVHDPHPGKTAELVIKAQVALQISHSTTAGALVLDPAAGRCPPACRTNFEADEFGMGCRRCRQQRRSAGSFHEITHRGHSVTV